MPKVLISDKMDPRAAEIFRERGVEVLSTAEVDDIPAAIKELTDGRGADGAAVDVEAEGGGRRRRRPRSPCR